MYTVKEIISPEPLWQADLKGVFKMKATVNEYQFVDSFEKMGRGDNFSYEGKKALFNYLEELGEDTGSEIELDVIALCCEYTEFEDWEEFKANYTTTATDIEDAILPDFEEDDELTKEDYIKELLEELRNHTTIIDIDGTSFIIQDF